MNPEAMSEYEIRRALDLPGPLPPGETVLWMGAPSASRLAISAFHLPALGLYFGCMVALHGAWLTLNGALPGVVLASCLKLGALAACALAMFWLLAWLTARSAVYAITQRRLLMRIGVALSVTINLPLRMLVSVDLREYKDASGDIALTLSGSDHLAYLHLWPHARPWRLKPTVPMLRAVADAGAVARYIGMVVRSAQLGGQPPPPMAVPGRPRQAGWRLILAQLGAGRWA